MNIFCGQICCSRFLFFANLLQDLSMCFCLFQMKKTHWMFDFCSILLPKVYYLTGRKALFEGFTKIASIRQKVMADWERLTKWVCHHDMHLRGKGVDKERHSVKGILGETITFIPGCGNGQLEEVRGQLSRNSFKHFECFWGRIQYWGRNVFKFKFFASPYYLGLTSLWLSFLTYKNGARESLFCHSGV